MPVDLVVNKGSKIRSTDGFIDPCSRIPDAHQHAAGAVELRPDAQDARPVGDGAHRFDAVHDEIHDDLLQLNLVAQRRWQRRRQLRLDGHVPAPQRTHREPEDLPDGLIDIERAVFGLAMRKQRPDAPDHFAGAVALR